MMTAVSIFSCTNDYYPGLIENLGMKEQPLRIITKVNVCLVGNVGTAFLFLLEMMFFYIM